MLAYLEGALKIVPFISDDGADVFIDAFSEAFELSFGLVRKVVSLFCRASGHPDQCRRCNVVAMVWSGQACKKIIYTLS